MSSALIATTALETLVPAVTSRQLYEDERTVAEFLHAEEMRLEEQQHDAEQRQGQQLHSQKLQYDTELFVHDMRVDIALATRDATRDAIRLCSQVASSIVMCDALLLNCVFQQVSQFNVPSTGPDGDTASGQLYTTDRMHYGLALWAALLTTAFAALTGSVVTCLRLQKVVSGYDIGHPLHRYRPCGLSHSNFNKYFVCHCQHPELQCRRLCAAGAVLTLLSGCVWAYINFVASGAAYDVGTFVLFVLPVSVALVLYIVGPWALPDRTRDGPREFVGMPASSVITSGAALWPKFDDVQRPTNVDAPY